MRRILTGRWRVGVAIVCLAAAFVTVPTFAPLARGPQYEEILQLGRGTIKAVSWHPDGQAFAVGGSLGIWIYDSAMALIARLEAPSTGIVAFSSDGAQLASVGGSMVAGGWTQSSTIDIWDLETRNKVRTLVPADDIGGIRILAWHPGSGQLAGIGNQGFLVWNAESGELLKHLASNDRVEHIAWSPDGRLLAAVTYDAVRLWDVERSVEVTRFEVMYGQALAWSPDGERFALVRGGGYHRIAENTLQIWSVTDSRPLVVMQADTATTVDWSSDGRFVATGTDEYSTPVVEVWDPANGTLIARRIEHARAVHTVRWQPGTGRLLTASEDNTVHLWQVTPELPFEREAVVLREHAGTTWTLDWAPDGQRIVTGGEDGVVRVWRLDGSDEVVHLASRYRIATVVAWSPDGSRIASAAAEQPPRVDVWDANTGESLGAGEGARAEIAGVPGGDQMGAGTWSPDGTHFVVNLGAPIIYRWPGDDNGNVERLSTPATLVIHPTNMEFSVDAARVAGVAYIEAQRMGAILIWDTDMADVQMTIPCDGCGPRHLAWSLDERFLAGSGYFSEQSGIVRIWDTTNGALVRELTTTGFENVSDLSWSADGWLAGVHASGVTLWDALAAEAEPVHIAWPYGPRVARWSPDATALAIAGEAGLISIYRQR